MIHRTFIVLKNIYCIEKKKTFIVLVTQWVTGSLVLLLKLLISKIHQNYCYINYILKLFDFQCDLDFQITTSKMILISNHLYLGDFILIFKSSTYDDFAHLCSLHIAIICSLHFFYSFQQYFWMSVQKIRHKTT